MIYEFEGKTERDAIDKAIAELGVESDQFDVEIVEIQKNSLFKKGYAKIRVHIDDKATVERPTSDTPLQSEPGREAATDKEVNSFMRWGIPQISKSFHMKNTNCLCGFLLRILRF